jgi:signal transduction histidine kinase/GAF domain-containing protein
VLPGDLAAVPWPALLVSANGAVLAASPGAVALLGMRPSDIAALEDRFEVLSTAGQPVPRDQHPLQRASRAELFQVGGIWRDRDSGRELSLRFRCRAVGADGLLEIDSLVEDAERRATERLSKLNEALLGRKPGESVISVRELLLQLVLLATEITEARYGALGILKPDGISLRDFVYVGIPEDTATAIGHLPIGKGLLGAVICEGRTIRVPVIDADPRSSGFPPYHPPMTSFLGTPLRVGEEIFGNFYLADKQGGAAFTPEDARLLERFSAQASLTVAYARQAEEEERRIFETVVQHAPHGIVYFPADPAGEVLGNPAAERMLGRITRGNDPARTYELKHPDGTTLADRELPSTRALREEAVINLEVVIERRNCRATPALLSAAPVHSESGVTLGAVLIFQDITALKQFQHLRQDFMALVAHDLRTPLAAVLYQLEVVMLRATGEAAAVPVSTLQLMKKNGQRLDRLIRDLLDASQVDAQRVQLDLGTVRVPDLVSSIVTQVAGALGTHAVVVVVTGEPPPVLADPHRFEQVVTNLLENAAKYADEGTTIRIRIEPSGRGVALFVEDHGPGISPEELPRLFDRYFQTQRARAKRRGLGLGLFITKGLVEAHGGTIGVESVPGTGSIFRIWLPAAP